MALFGSADAAERWMANGYTPSKRPLGQRTSSSPRIGGTPRTLGSGAPSSSAAQKAAHAAGFRPPVSLPVFQYAPGPVVPRTIGTVQMPTPRQYPTTPAPLTAAQLAELDGRRIEADERYGEALAYQEAGKQRTGRDLHLGLQQLANQFRGARTSVQNSLGAAGLALSPASMVSSMNALRDQDAEQTAVARLSASDALAELARQVGAAKRQRDATIAAIGRQRATYGADLNQLLPGTSY